MAERIVECTHNIDDLFEIDQNLKELLIKLSNMKHKQESFSVILYTNQLALLNYQKVSCLVDKKNKNSSNPTKSSGLVNLPPKSIHEHYMKSS